MELKAPLLATIRHFKRQDEAPDIYLAIPDGGDRNPYQLDTDNKWQEMYPVFPEVG